MSGIFISYRDEDAKPWALLLRDELAEAFGDEQVFLDKDTLGAGSWREQIQQALDRCRVVVVVIGPRWLTVADGGGARRLDNPEDVHRQEIAAALARHDVTVIPVRVDGARMPRAQELPADIRTLPDQQSFELGDRSTRRRVELRALVGEIERTARLVATRRKQGVASFASLVRALLVAPVIGIVILVFADLGLGWTLDSQEKLLVFGFVVFAVLMLAWSRHRGKGATSDAR
jgi:hypothetical protein